MGDTDVEVDHLVKFEVQLYKVRDDEFVIDMQVSPGNCFASGRTQGSMRICCVCCRIMCTNQTCVHQGEICTEASLLFLFHVFFR